MSRFSRYQQNITQTSNDDSNGQKKTADAKLQSTKQIYITVYCHKMKLTSGQCADYSS